MSSSFNPAKRLRVAAMKLLLGDGDGSADELDGVLADLESVASGLAEFIMLLQMCPPALYRPLATSIYADSQMFGRHVERRRVLEFLLQGDEGEPASAELGVLLWSTRARSRWSTRSCQPRGGLADAGARSS